jgi:hypothetical protein
MRTIEELGKNLQPSSKNDDAFHTARQHEWEIDSYMGIIISQALSHLDGNGERRCLTSNVASAKSKAAAVQRLANFIQEAKNTSNTTYTRALTPHAPRATGKKGLPSVHACSLVAALYQGQAHYLRQFSSASALCLVMYGPG